MNPDIMEQYVTNGQGDKKRKLLVAGLIVLIMSIILYFLILPAITLDKKTYCGYEAHEHSEAAGCYEVKETLICNLEETAGHKHSDACYEKQRGMLKCTNKDPEHVHDDSCYEMKNVLVCGKKESSGHQHGDSCHKKDKKLICTKDVHEHSLQCYSNPEADIETAKTWEDNLSEYELTGDWSKDVVEIAKTQLGYSESELNYDVVDKDSMNGYTRYGDWFGDKYGDWCAMFCSFCMHYAAVDPDMIPSDSNCQEWIETLKKIDNDEDNDNDYKLYHSSSKYEPKVGDLVFFDWDSYEEKSDRVSDHIGIVAELVYEDEKDVKKGEEPQLIGIRTIEGNASDEEALDCVKYREYELDSQYIMGYAEMPENPDPDNTPLHVSDVDEVTETVGEKNKENDEKAEELEKVDEDSVIKEEKPKKKTMMMLGAPGPGEDPEPMPVHDSYLADLGKLTISSTWNGSVASNLFTVTLKGPSKDDQLVLYNGSNASGNAISTSQRAGDKTASISVTNRDTYPITDINSKWTIKYTGKDNKYQLYGPITVYDILEGIKPGFDEWLRTIYLTDYDNTQLPEDLDELYDAFDIYYDLPIAKISKDDPDSTGAFDVHASLEDVDGDPVDVSGYTIKWFYKNVTTDEDDNEVIEWLPLNDNNDNQITGTSFRGDQVDTLKNGGKVIRCVAYENNKARATSNELLVNAEQKEYDDIIATINSELSLGAYPIWVGGSSNKGGNGQYRVTPDVSINGDKYKDNFYWTNVANDSRVQFYDGESYANYLVGEYKKAYAATSGDANAKQSAALDAVKKIWERYLFDIYDPSENGSIMTNVTTYPDNTYGDQYPDFVKDQNSSSFHGTKDGTENPALAPKVKALEYNFLEDGVDYGNFVKGLSKDATAKAAGNANGERKYDIEITADAQAQATAPVAMVLQIQTAWQLFDLMHANAQPGEGKTEVGSASYNTELANLYDIKNALLRFVDYMETNYPGNNLVLGITETRHDASQTMFLGTDDNGKPLYVTNDYDVLKDGITKWDTFGNCEHVHYDSNMLQYAVNNLQSNLSGWEDMYKHPIAYDDIQKVAVIIGGPTEDSDGENGWKCVLPWSTFQTKGIDSVYGIRVNEGTSVNGNPISWLDYSGNNTGDPYDGTNSGTNFTKKYVATTEDAVFNTLVSIAEKEMKAQGTDINNPDAQVENVTVTDKVCDEFVIDESQKPVIKVTDSIANEQGVIYEGYEHEIEWDDSNLTVTENSDGTTTVTYNFGSVHNTQKCTIDFGIVAKEDYIGSNNVKSNVGTPDLTYQHTKSDSGVTSTYDVNCEDTPEVNVPIIFSAEDGGETTVPIQTRINLSELDVDSITKNIYDLIDNYDQINGKITYEWVLPAAEGVTPEVVPVAGVEVPVAKGKVTGDYKNNLPSVDELKELYKVTLPDDQNAYLRIKFTPDYNANSKNFSESDNGVTKTAVTDRTEAGKVTIHSLAIAEKRDIYITKQWMPKVPSEWRTADENHTLHFRLIGKIGNDIHYIGKDSNNEYILVEDIDDAITFDLNNENCKETEDGLNNIWQTVIKDLPGWHDDQIIEYSLDEVNIPEGYELTCSDSSITREIIPTVADVTFTLENQTTTDQGIIKDLYLEIPYTINGVSGVGRTGKVSLDKGKTDKNGTTYNSAEVTLSGITIPDDINNGTYSLNNLDIRIDATNIKYYKVDKGTWTEQTAPSDAHLVIKSGTNVTVANKQQDYKVKATVTITPSVALTNKELTIKYKYKTNQAVEIKKKVTAAAGESFVIEIDDLPINPETNAPYTFTIAEVKGIDAKNLTIKTKTEKYTDSGSFTTDPILIATNEDKRDTVIVEKIIQENVSESDGTEFQFKATLEDGKTFPEILPEDQMFNEDNDVEYVLNTDHTEATFSLKDGEQIRITVNDREDITITELNYDGYYPIIRIDGKDGNPGDTTTVTPIKDETVVSVYNKAGVELPKTGGIGTWMFTLGGAILIAIALMWMVSMRRRSERGLE